MCACTMYDYKNYPLTDVSRRSLVSCRNECDQEGCFHVYMKIHECSSKQETRGSKDLLIRKENWFHEG